MTIARNRSLKGTTPASGYTHTGSLCLASKKYFLVVTITLNTVRLLLCRPIISARVVRDGVKIDTAKFEITEGFGFIR